MERVMGLEPTISAWKANVLPLHYTRRLIIKVERETGLSSAQAAYPSLPCRHESSVISLHLLIRKRARSARLSACKRAADGSLSLPLFCGIA